MRSLFLLVVIVSLLVSGCIRGAQDENAAVSNVTITKFPHDDADASPEICWRVDGIGASPHTDLHITNESHAPYTSGTPAQVNYHAGTSVLPDNADSAEPHGYSVPDEFCANVDRTDQPLYIVAHAVDAQNNQHRFSGEQVLLPSPDA